MASIWMHFEISSKKCHLHFKTVPFFFPNSTFMNISYLEQEQWVEAWPLPPPPPGSWGYPGPSFSLTPHPLNPLTLRQERRVKGNIPILPRLPMTFHPKPNSWKYNFVVFSGYNLESSQTWGFCMDFLNHREGGIVFYQVFAFLLYCEL